MTKPLPPFSGDDATCAKCSNVGAYTEWRGAEYPAPAYRQQERLRRRCARCEYEWDEALNPPKGAA